MVGALVDRAVVQAESSGANVGSSRNPWSAKCASRGSPASAPPPRRSSRASQSRPGRPSRGSASGAHRHHHLAQRAQLAATCAAEPGSKKIALNRIGGSGAHLLEHRELESALHRDDSAVVHRALLSPEAAAQPLDRLAQPLVRDRERDRKKPSPFGPYAPPGETTTPDSSSTSSQYDAEVWPSGTGAQT